MSEKNEAINALGNLVNGTENETETEVKEEEAPKTEEPVENPAQDEEESTDEKAETDYKAESRKWEARAKANKAAADELPKMTEKLESVRKELAEQKKATESAQAALTRYKVASKYAVSEEDMELFLTGSDEETLEKQAAALSERTAKTPRPDRAQGNRNGSGATTNRQRFADVLADIGL
ncbi:hypothetical protein [Streptomyces collinus]|uniref:hypothetical protein n=1 Tax=Streptomyces collinus TaxID=42684 RepID=UPI003694E25B